ncbi:MAG: hypothetical protein ACLFQK_04910 [Fibrobacterota bacterium]
MQILGNILEFLAAVFEITVFQILIILSPLAVCGFILRILKIAFESLIPSAFGTRAYMFFAAIGTPVHEIGHILACLIFRHKITGFSLFSREGSSLGYVEHSYDRRSIYQSSGNFFIGLAPFIFGSAILYFSVKRLYPEFSLSKVPLLSYDNIKNFSSISYFADYSLKTFGAVKSKLDFFFSIETYRNWRIYPLIIILIGIGGHISPSMNDFRGAARGFRVIFILILILNAVFYFFGGISVELLSTAALKTGILVNILIFAAVINFLALLIPLSIIILKRLISLLI